MAKLENIVLSLLVWISLLLPYPWALAVRQDRLFTYYHIRITNDLPNDTLQVRTEIPAAAFPDVSTFSRPPETKTGA
ncbi:hypothetical protein V6N13_008846 [Hibiscus sabdariffa]|uniref:Uncharacterized protein n=1 Tax=Hibiscus sabdariffa TaxID=183260 RepID=A0ABR2B1E6_9ROSI